MIVWGGELFGTYDNGGIYDPATDTWESTPLDGAPVFRRDLAAVWTGSEMIVWGGHDGTSGGWRDDGGRLDPVSGVWTPVSTSRAPDARSLHSAVWTGSEMIVWGGIDLQGNMNTGGRYDPLTDSWEPTRRPQAPSPRTRYAFTWTGTEMIIWGGLGTGGASDRLGDGSRYDPVADDWTPMSEFGAPTARRDPVAVWTGDVAIVWGGSDSHSVPRHGGRYDPVTDSWIPTSFSVAPESPLGFSTVWTGNEMIVWGGGGLATGGRYDPALDSWRATTQTGAPEGRDAHSAVWTGSEMIVWGGAVGTTQLTYPRVGGRYDPLLDTWQSTSVTGATPPGGWGHSAVWTGEQMIIWGGNDGQGNQKADGGRYNPVTDQWQQMDTGATARERHTAIWTGSEMVVWGGFGPTSLLGSGDRYSPVTDDWSPIAAAGAPPPRHFHSAVWTGTEMIVWGGNGSTAVRESTGGRWDPVSDTWQPTSQVGVPPGRGGHAAAWTGEKMVVWGGMVLASGVCCVFSAEGGRYDPLTDTWEPTSSVDAPPPMAWLQGHWTGELMLIWGEREGGVYASGPGPQDGDGDTFLCDEDCDDADPGVWDLPGEAGSLQLGSDAVTISWSPASPGGTTVLYDTLRSDRAGDFVSAGTCVESGGADLSSIDATLPPPGEVFHYFVRPRNACGASPSARAALSCP
jgi:N-acetylneuraminic acid mutarotase